MRPLAASVIALTALLGAGSVQSDMTDERHVERMQSRLKLTDEQAKAVRRIFEEARPQLDALRKQRRDLQDKTRERLKAVLTPEQVKEFDRIHEERKERRNRPGGPGRP